MDGTSPPEKGAYTKFGRVNNACLGYIRKDAAGNRASSIFITEPHYNRFPAVFVYLSAVDGDDLKTLTGPA